ncbi:MAG: M16 family metallopeptidase [Polyangiaceae bacterium]
MQRFDLEGGGLALHEGDAAVPLVSFAISLRSGSASDPAGKSGLARIAMRMLRRGAPGMSAEQIDVRIDSLGAELSVDTSPSTVAMHAQVIARNLDAFVDLVATLLGSPTFPEDELARLKRETVAEIIEARDNDRVIAHKALQRTLFADHPYGRNAGGTTLSVESIQRADVVAFYERHVVRRNAVVGISGDVSEARAAALASRLLAGLRPGAPVADDVAEPAALAGRRLVVVDKPERTQTQILVATLGTSPGDEDHAALVVANAVFGGTFTSRLMREIRSKRGWSYGASSRVAIDRHRQAWVLWTFPAAEDAPPCLALSLELLQTWIEKGVTPREVGFIQRYLVRSHAFEIDTAAKRLHQALDVELLGLPPDYYSGWIDHVRAVTADSASEAVRRRIATDSLLAVVVGTASQVADPVRKVVPGLTESTVVPFDQE